ncbi:ferric iron uptake transcriptional regulator [Gammaproteobacteria bacterium]|jgi:Fur family ferric uptake transcriptional regulator|nr:ferric iron uptake transcriptional regulator [Gammaproteobacteria bacterium]MDA9069094.1 ferric iron uptake transcriptional regulator [Gammaproteobacteria bacterium]MDA9306580.1 ferric iron uptake transcriptional regulator [Gammaproteobacteria bacterium]MDB4242996.1 ferric iron uptake transcriptional regulator [Gammaproteobacteria bacterium]MDB9769804.1 ferric iron uptake transcriptional regulator [Gammaproteobacteria bacterium]
MSKENTELKKAGLKATLPRIRILEALESHGKERINSEHHLSAEDLYKQLITSGEDVGLATVYRVLTQFEAAGIVKRHNFEDGHSVYEIAEEEHHDHMICLETGAVNEFTDDLIEQRQKDIAAKFGYELVDHTMVLYVKPIK